MRVAPGKSQEATDDVVRLVLKNDELCQKLAEHIHRGGSAGGVEAIIKGAFRTAHVNLARGLRQMRSSARVQAHQTSMWSRFELMVDWSLIAKSVIDTGAEQ